MIRPTAAGEIPNSGGELAHGEVGTAVHRHQQHPFLQGQCPRAARSVRVQGPTALPVDGPYQTLPKKAELASEHRIERLEFEKVLGRAVMYLIAAVARETAMASKEEFAGAVFDETWHLTSSDEGLELLLELMRDGRKHNAAACSVLTLDRTRTAFGLTAQPQ